jgi:ubiquitin C-terminal hydrolase
MGDKQLGGLVNMGLTCYANAVMQAMRHCKKVPWILEEGRYTTLLKKDATGTRDKQQILTKSFANTVQLLQQCKIRQSVRPADFWRKFHTCIEEHSFGTFDKFKHKMCHDSHEFYICLLDILHDSMAQEVEMRIVREPPTTETDRHCVQALTAWKQQFSKNYSPFVDLFYGLYHYVVTCKGCGKGSHRWEPFTELKGVPPVSGSGEGKEAVSLLEMIREEFKPTMIGDYDCDTCRAEAKGRTEAVQTVSVWRFPKYLVIHLKRFGNDGRKIHTPLLTLPNQGESPVSFESLYSDETPEKGGSCAYKLVSMVDHHGHSMAGHYTAQARSTEDTTKWHIFDDDSCTPIPNPVFGSSTYMMWFERT